MYPIKSESYPVRLVVLFSILFLTSCQSWFYRPSKEIFFDPRVFGHQFQEVKIEIPWEGHLHGWKLISHQESNRNPAQGTILYFHEGTKNISYHFNQMAWLTKKNQNLFMIDYQGFGKSSGSADPEKMVENTIRSLNYVKHRQTGKFIVYCQSTAGLICLKAIAKWKYAKEIDLLVLDSAYASYKELGKYYLSRSWMTNWMKHIVAFFISGDDATDIVSKIRVPTLVIHSLKNSSVPYELGEYIYDNLNTKKKLWKIQRAHHLETFNNDAKKSYFVDLILGLPKSIDGKR